MLQGRLREVRLPWPLGALRFDVVLHAYGVDTLGRSGDFLVCAASASQASWPAHPFPPPPAHGRHVLSRIVLRLTPRAGGRTHVDLALKIDPREMPEFGAAPRWVAEWMVANVLTQIFGEMAACAQRMHDAPDTSEHVRAIAESADFYEVWMRPRLAATVGAEAFA